MERFEEIYRQFHSKVLAYILSRVRPPEDAEDVCSEVFEKVLRGLDTYDESRGAVSTWLYRITHNAVLDHIRTQHPAEELDDSLVSEAVIDDTLLRRENLAALAEAVERLGSVEHDVIVLRYFEGCTRREVSDRMGIPYHTIVRLERKALSQLALLLKDFF